ncbi:MAG TPA: phage major capsid protein [Clostridiales bacterium]|nr:MAG: hypothetical protein A2Y22_08650 [Clostridiales bacterium GWD2_32_59]HAN09368.1 phage major capsid protein [Clostridiales bacterium]
MLKQLMLNKKIQQRKSILGGLIEKENEFKVRNQELSTSIDEAKTDEEITVIEEEITKLETEKTENEEKKTALEREIAGLEDELNEIITKGPEKNKTSENSEERKKSNIDRGNTRMRENKLNARELVIERLNKEDVRSFYTNLSQAVQKRSISGLDLTIPQILLDTITDDLGRYSVFYDLVRKAKLTGEGRAIISGEAPEAIWTEMVGKLNELASLFTDVEVDGYKVGGFIPLDNSLIEDSMVNLASHVEELLKESIAIALDKAILYGTGTKMPLGIVPAIHADFVDDDPDKGLRTTNIITLSVADTKFAKIIEAMKFIKRGRRGRGPITIAMNEATWLGTIVPMSLASNASGAFVTVSGQAFPGVGYKVVFSEEIPENNIIAGDFTKYLLAERADVKTASSTEFLFTSDKTVFKATARYDGKPVRKGAFVLIGLNNTAPTVAATFATDAANE